MALRVVIPRTGWQFRAGIKGRLPFRASIACSRMAVSWARRALEGALMGCWQRPDRSLAILHSERGIQFISAGYQRFLTRTNISVVLRANSEAEVARLVEPRQRRRGSLDHVAHLKHLRVRRPARVR